MADEDATASSEAVPTFKKIKRNKNVRARPSAADDDGAAAAGAVSTDAGGGLSEVVRPSKVAKANPLVVGTARSDKKKEERDVFDSDRRISNYDNKATAENLQDVDRSNDAQAQFEEAKKMWEDGGDVAADGSKIYRGQKAYRPYTNTAESFDSQVMSGAGPARAPVHYRATSRFDYQPDICKDYKDTGFCGYGDACKFLHDRSDYKSGWQLEKQWEEEQRAKAHADAIAAFDADASGSGGGGGSGSSAAARRKTDDDNLPFACLICREPWHATSRPVVTRCEHYFCESCALQQASKTKRCFVCAENTGGIFNTAKAIQEKIDRMKEKQEVDKADDETNESIIAQYEASKAKQRGYTGGWAIV